MDKIKYNKEQIKKEYLKGKSLRYSETKNNIIEEYIEEIIKLNISHKEKVYCFINDYIPKCKNPKCNKIPNFQNFNLGYKDYCSVSCSVICSKEKQEESRVRNIQENIQGLTVTEIVEGLYNETIKIQKWRDIEKLNNYKNFNSLEQLYKHIILKDNQICEYCNNPYNIDKITKETRKCNCTTTWDRQVMSLTNMNNIDFLKFIVDNNLYHYSKSKNSKIRSIYNKRFIKKYENFMEQINYDCKKNNIYFTGYYCNISKGEKEVFNFIKNFYNKEIIENDRSLGIELDIYIPELKIAIEYNGLYWHSSKFKDKKYHLNKTEICENNNIQLIHIFENEWLLKQDIVKSILKAKLGYTENKIFARKCIIKEVPSKISNKFLEDNHIQGKDNASIRYGLYYKNNLVQLMTFKRSHRSKDKYMELKRSCSILNTNIIGGFSKLLKYSKKIIQEDIVTFADRRYSYKENVYNKVGIYISSVPPNHFYINGLNLESREKYQKHKLSEILETFEEEKTALENCHNNGLYEIYDSGNRKYIL